MEHRRYECRKCGYYQIGLQIGENCPSCGRKLRKTNIVIEEKEEVFKCKYCGHRQTGLNGSYLCPQCHHALVPVRASSPKAKKHKALPWLIAILVILIIVFLAQKSILPKFFNLPQRFIQTEADVPPQQDKNEFVFTNQTKDLITSQLDGKTYLTIETDIKPSAGISYDTEIKLNIIQNDKTIYHTTETVGTLTPLKAYHFSSKTNLTDIVGFDPMASVAYNIEVSGHSVSLTNR